MLLQVGVVALGVHRPRSLPTRGSAGDGEAPVLQLLLDVELHPPADGRQLVAGVGVDVLVVVRHLHHGLSVPVERGVAPVHVQHLVALQAEVLQEAVGRIQRMVDDEALEPRGAQLAVGQHAVRSGLAAQVAVLPHHAPVARTGHGDAVAQGRDGVEVLRVHRVPGALVRLPHHAVEADAQHAMPAVGAQVAAVHGALRGGGRIHLSAHAPGRARGTSDHGGSDVRGAVGRALDGAEGVVGVQAVGQDRHARGVVRGAQGDAVRRGRAQVHLTGIHGNGAPRTKASLVIGSVQRVATARTAAGEQRVRYAQQLHAAHVHVGASAVHVQLALQVVRPEAPIDQAEGAHQDVAQPHLQVGQAVRVGGRVVRLLVHHRPRRNALPDAHAEGHVLPGQGFTQRIAHHALVVEGLGRLTQGHGR